MRARVGDRLLIKGTTLDKAHQHGLSTEVHWADGSPPTSWLA